MIKPLMKKYLPFSVRLTIIGRKLGKLFQKDNPLTAIKHTFQLK